MELQWNYGVQWNYNGTKMEQKWRRNPQTYADLCQGHFFSRLGRFQGPLTGELDRF